MTDSGFSYPTSPQRAKDRAEQRIFRSDKTKESKRRFTRVDNGLIEDDHLSGLAVGIGTYLLSKPDNWVFTNETIGYRFREGRKAIARAMKELEDAGYLVRERNQGRVDVSNFFHEVPATEGQSGHIGIPKKVVQIRSTKSGQPKEVDQIRSTNIGRPEGVGIVTTEEVTTEEVTTEEELRKNDYSSVIISPASVMMTDEDEDDDFILDDSLEERMAHLDNPPVDDEVIEVYSHYLAITGMPSGLKPGDEDTKHISARLQDGFTVEHLKMVVSQAKVDAFWSDTTKNHRGRLSGYMKSRDNVHALLVTARRTQEEAETVAAIKAAEEARRNNPAQMAKDEELDAMRARLLGYGQDQYSGEAWDDEAVLTREDGSSTVEALNQAFNEGHITYSEWRERTEGFERVFIQKALSGS